MIQSLPTWVASLGLLCGWLAVWNVSQVQAEESVANTPVASVWLVFPAGADDRDFVVVQLHLPGTTPSFTNTLYAALDRLFDFLNRDGDEHLSAVEAARSPTPYEIRRLLWGASFVPQPHAAGIRPTGEKISRTTFRQFYEQHGIGLSVAQGHPPSTVALNERLLEVLDLDHNGQITPAECNGAWKTLVVLDRNEDELVSVSELLSSTLYPGAKGANLATPLPSSVGPTVFAFMDEKALTQLDSNSDGRLDQAEMERLGKQQPITWQVAFQAEVPHVAQKSVKLEMRSNRQFALWSDPGQATKLLGVTSQIWRQRMLDADHNRDGSLAADEIPETTGTPLRQLLEYADRNADHLLSTEELNVWLQLLHDLTQAQQLLTVLHFDQGLFECLDSNVDGHLSVMEMRKAQAKLQTYGGWVDKQLQLKRLPKTVHLCLSGGHPKTQLPRPALIGPSWFTNLDRNEDGVVSRREFIGETQIFSRFDLDNDGLITPSEATTTP